MSSRPTPIGLDSINVVPIQCPQQSGFANSVNKSRVAYVRCNCQCGRRGPGSKSDLKKNCICHFFLLSCQLCLLFSLLSFHIPHFHHTMSSGDEKYELQFPRLNSVLPLCFLLFSLLLHIPHFHRTMSCG